MKVCCTCHEPRPLSWYTKARNRKDGLYPQCRVCRKIANRANYLKHRDAITKRAKEYANRPEIRKRIHERCKKNYWDNRDVHLEHAKQWRFDNLERRRAYVCEWNEKNREKVRAYQQAYKIRLRYGTESALTHAGWKMLLDIFRNRCAYCGKENPQLEQDHVQPLSRDGKHEIGNVVPACRSCNAKKAHHTAPPFWWATTRVLS